MKISKNKKSNNSSEESKELDKINEELQDFIDNNESLKIGINKIIEEIKKDKSN